MKKILLMLVILTGCIGVGWTQQAKLDSLLRVNEAYQKEDSLKVIYLRYIFGQYAILKQFDKVESFGEAAVSLAKKLPNKSILEVTYYKLGASYHGVSDYLKALSYYEKALEVGKEAADKVHMADTYLNMGALYNDIPDYAKSLEAHQIAIILYEHLGKKGEVASCYMNIGDIYEGLGQFKQASEYIHKALKIFEDASSTSRGVAVACEALGNILMMASDNELMNMRIRPAEKYEKALQLFNRALPIAEKEEDYSMKSSIMTGIGKIYEARQNKETALKYYLTSMEVNKKANEKLTLAENYLNLGRYYTKNKDYGNGFINLKQGLDIARQINVSGVQKNALESLSNLYETTGRFDSSLFYYREYIVMRDSIYNNEKEREITRKQLQLDFNIKEREYKLTQQLTDESLKQQILLAKQQQQEIILRKQQLEISDQEKSLQRVAFLKKEADLENAKKLEITRLQKEQLRARFDKKIKDSRISAQQAQIEFDAKLSTALAIIAITTFAAGILVFYNHYKTVKLNKLVSKQKQTLEELVSVKDTIFGIVSHDLRTQVNNLISFSSLLANGHIEQKRLAQYTELIKGTLDHTASLMDNLLNWSASQMQGFAPVIEDIDMAAIVEHVINGAHHTIGTKNLTVNNSVKEGVRVLGDRNMVELIVRNLVSNAIKFSGQDGLLEIFAKRDGKGMVLSVRDNGVGISETKVQQINDVAIKSIESTHGTNREKGTGLGLLLSKHFAAILHGNITVNSRPGAGSIFHITLPAA